MAKYITCHRRGTAEQWANYNTLIPLEGEIVIEIDEVNSLHKLKIGDGRHTYAELAYLKAGDEIVTQVLAEAKPRVVTVELMTDWNQDAEGKYSQTLTFDNITKNSRLDLQPSADMLAEFKRLGLVFVTENNGGTITVYSVGNMPSQAYTMQATIVETECNGDTCVVGMPVGTPVPTKISELTNDAGYLTSYTETDPTVPSHVKNITTNDISKWNNKSDFDGNYNNLTNKPTIPTKTSDLTNDNGFITADALSGLGGGDMLKATYDTNNNGKVDVAENAEKLGGVAASSYATTTYVDTAVSGKANTADIPDALADLTADSTHRTVTDAEKATWNAKSNFSGNYNDLTNKPTIPTVPSALKNPNALTFGTQTYDGSVAKTITAADLGLSGAMKFLGTSTTAVSDGSTTKTITVNGSSVTVEAGNVVLYNGAEYVWDGAKWEELGHEGSFKVKQTAVASPSASGNATAFIDTISQDANGNISVTKKNVQFPVTSVAGKTGAVTLAKGDVGLGNVDNTADADKNVKYAGLSGSTDSVKFRKISAAPTGDGCYPVSVATAFTIGNVTFPVYSKGMFIATGTGDATLYVVDANGRTYTAFRNSGTWQNAREVINSGNIGSQSVSYATSAGSATTATSATSATKDASGNVITSTYLPKSGGTMSGKLTAGGGIKVSGAASDKPLMVRGIVGSDGADTVADLFLQYGANSKIMLGNNGEYSISEDGSTYNGNAATATKATQDGSGNTITSTYATKTELTNAIASAITTALNTAV